MSASLGSVMIAIKAVDEASSVMDKIRASTSLLGSAFQSMDGTIGSVGNVMQGFAAGGVAGAAVTAIGEVAKGFKWAIGEASEAEQAIKNLSIAVEKSGIAWDSVKEGTLSALSNLQKFTVYSDEQLAATLQRMLTFGMSYDEAMKALGTATDLAAAKNIDLESAAGLVGKAFMGNTAILQRYGIDIQTSKEASTALKDAITILADGIKTGGDNLSGFSSTLAEAGVTLTTTEGKMRGAKDIAEELIGAFQSGTIDAEAFDQIMGELGVTIDTSKLKAADFPTVMAALNEQFGGTAQEQAKTYEGIQKRLANATSDLGEKIGGMLLPALASLTESMIPVVDWIGKGVDAYQGWTAEFEKTAPAWLKTSTYLDALGEAFSGLWKGMQDFWGFLSETFGPVLQELGGALKEVFDALAPIGQAFGEVWAAITGGQEGGDWLKDFLKFVAQFIREVVVPAIKEVVPVIKGFADAFKAAADFALPIITTIKDAVVGFIEALKTAFYGFYTWLVGGSLWMDMWKAMLSIAGQIWDKILGAGKTWLDNFTSNITTWAGNLQANWAGTWNAVHTAFTTIGEQIGTAVNTKFTEMRSFVQTNLGEYAPIATSALDAMQSATNAGLDLLKGDWQGALDNLNSALTSWGDAAKGLMDGIMGQLKGSVDAGIGLIKGAWDGMTSGLQQATQAAAAPMQAATQTVMDSVSGAVTGFWNWLTGGSYWPEHLEGMRTMTESKLGEVADSFTKFGQDVTQRLTSALQGAQQAAQQGMAAIEATLGTVATKAAGMTSDAADAIHDSFVKMLNPSGGAFEMPQAFEDLWHSANGLAVQLGSGLVSATEAIAQSMQALGQGISPTVQAFEGLKEQFSSGAISATAFQNALEILVQGGQAFEGVSIAVGNQLAAMVQQFEDMTGITVTWADGWTDSMNEVQSVTQDGMAGVTGTFQDTFSTITSAASNFWNWLVGGSVWPEGMTSISDTTQSSMQQVSATISDTLQVLHDKFLSWFEAVQANHVGFWDNYFIPKLVEALGIVNQTFTVALASISQLWQMSWIQIETILSNTYVNMQKRSIEWWPQMTGLFTQQVAFLQQVWTNAWMMMEQTLSTSLMRMQSVARSVLGSILSEVQNVMMRIQQAAAQLQAQLVTGSIWPDMMNTMASITDETMAQIETRVVSGYERMVASAQASLNSLQSIQQQAVSFLGSYTGGNASAAFLSAQQAASKAAISGAGKFGTAIGGGYTYDVGIVGESLAKEGYWNPATSMNLNAQGMAQFGQALAEATFLAKYGRSSAAGPYGTLKNEITVQIDGATVAKTVEQRMISQQQSAGGY